MKKWRGRIKYEVEKCKKYAEGMEQHKENNKYIYGYFDFFLLF